MNPKRIAVAWFREKDWPRWCASDADFQPDYQHWLRRMESVVRDLDERGIPAVRVVIDPGEFLQWSAENGQGVGTTARAAFAAICMRNRAAGH
ncbi:MAG: hypothetical protein ACR2HE_02460 [Casimicrobiaceae bacterium]